MSDFLTLHSLNKAGDRPRYEQIAKAICEAIRDGQLKPGDRLPTIRRLTTDLGVSLATVAAAFKSLSEDGWTRGETGRGTFVVERDSDLARGGNSIPANARHWPDGRSPWRQRAILSLMTRLRAAFPNATDCSTGRPDPALLPLKLIKRHWKAAFDDVTHRDLQYKTAEAIDGLESILRQRLCADGIPVKSGDLVVGTSSQQFMALTTDVVRRLGGSREVIAAVEQPGYATIFDTWDRAGVRMVGIETDEYGVRPESLEAAIAAGANMVLFTPRAQNPTGASWTFERKRSLGDVLSRYRQVLAIEDDHFGDIAEGEAGSLLADARIEDRVIHVRSFSKSIAPDLRLAVAAARPHLKALLQEAKSHADGWSSRLLQRVLARVLQDEELASSLRRARQTYRLRRERASSVFASCGLPGVVCATARDGVNLWIRFRSGADATEVIERAAALGVLVAPGEVFYLSPGHSDVVRFNAGSVATEQVTGCAELLVKALQQSGNVRSTVIHV
jgi:GntR family transcriptional regulator / MocR family aminotransferase